MWAVGNKSCYIDMADLRTMTSNRTCQVCAVRDATLLCYCTTPRIPLCTVCIDCHQDKYPATEHPQVSIWELERLEERGNKLRRSVEMMEECEREVAASVDEAIECMRRYKSWWVEWIGSESAKAGQLVEAAIEEAENCLKWKVPPESALAKALHTFPSRDFQVFQYSLSPPDTLALCNNWATYSLSLPTLINSVSNLPQRSYSHSLASVRQDQIRLYSILE